MEYTITPLTPHTGAEVRGIDLNEGVDAETRTTLNRAFVEHDVLVIRGQQFTPPHLREVLGLAGIPFGDGETWIAETLAVPPCRRKRDRRAHQAHQLVWSTDLRTAEVPSRVRSQRHSQIWQADAAQLVAISVDRGTICR